MSWKAVGPVVQKVVSRIVDTGEGSVAAEPRRPKRADPEGPASATEQRRREEEARMSTTANPGQEEFRAPLTVSRHRRVTSPNGLPRPVARLCLVIDNGGRDLAGRRDEVPAFRRNSWRERARETGLRVVVG